VPVEIQGIFLPAVNHGADLHISLSIHVGLRMGWDEDGTLENLGVYSVIY
jgi:hypothetical protein